MDRILRNYGGTDIARSVSGSVVFVEAEVYGSGDLPKDEQAEVDPELSELLAEWLEARDRAKGHCSCFSFDPQSDPPDVPTAAPTQRGRKDRSQKERTTQKEAWLVLNTITMNQDIELSLLQVGRKNTQNREVYSCLKHMAVALNSAERTQGSQE